MPLHLCINSKYFNDTRRKKQFSTRNGWLAASGLFHIFTQSIKFYTFHFYVLRVQMFEKCDSSSRQ